MNCREKNIFRSFFFAALFVAKSMLCFAQSNSFPPMQVQHINTNDGLADIAVYGFLQDKQGFIWILTFNGLQRYDGYTFKTYRYGAAHPDYITSGWFANMRADDKGIFWISDLNTGMWTSILPKKFSNILHTIRTIKIR